MAFTKKNYQENQAMAEMADRLFAEQPLPYGDESLDIDQIYGRIHEVRDALAEQFPTVGRARAFYQAHAAEDRAWEKWKEAKGMAQ